jgi:cytochrome d ubiquinol oxidase subunit II
MLYVVMAYLWAAILLYLLMGGADFGAGIIELFTSKKNRVRTRKTMYQAIGPIWEANHMWLIIVIVILFVGFPVIYSTMSVNLHIPLAVMLLGIIARGTAFAFRHYDAVVDDMHRIYNSVFVYSSFITPLFLGIIAGSAVAQTIDPSARTFADAYIFSWLSFFSFSVGLFTVMICGYLAAIFIIGETDNQQDRARFIRKARHMNIAAVISGVIVFVAARVDNVPLFIWIFGSATGIIAIIVALLSLFILWRFLNKGQTRYIRLLAGIQVTMILIAVTIRHYPNIVLLKNGEALSLLEHAGHEQTIFYLGAALLAGSIFILPALYYLLYSFHRKTI